MNDPMMNTLKQQNQTIVLKESVNKRSLKFSRTSLVYLLILEEFSNFMAPLTRILFSYDVELSTR